MAVFCYELKQLRGSVALWSLSLSAAIFCMMPVMLLTMNGAQGSFDSLLASFSGNGFFTALGIDIAGLASPVGAYTYILSVAAIAFAAFGGRLGISALSKEWSAATADFLLTKPHSRGSVYASKALAALCACAVTWLLFFAVSCATMSMFSPEGYDVNLFLQVAGSVGFLSVFYMALGLLIGALFPALRSPSLAALGVAFVTYIFGSFARVTKIDALLYLSPYAYVDGNRLQEHGGYDAKLWVLLALAALCAAAGYVIFKRKDIVISR